MKKLISILLIALYFPYVFVRFIAADAQLYIIIISIIIAFIFAFLNIVCALFERKSLQTDPKRRKSVNQTILIVKLALIPFYIFNFAVWSMLSGMFLLTPGGIFLDIIIVPMGIGFTYAILMATSSYSIFLLFALYKNNIISRKQFILHGIFQLVFVADIIDQFAIKKFTTVITVKKQPQ